MTTTCVALSNLRSIALSYGVTDRFLIKAQEKGADRIYSRSACASTRVQCVWSEVWTGWSVTLRHLNIWYLAVLKLNRMRSAWLATDAPSEGKTCAICPTDGYQAVRKLNQRRRAWLATDASPKGKTCATCPADGYVAVIELNRRRSAWLASDAPPDGKTCATSPATSQRTNRHLGIWQYSG